MKKLFLTGIAALLLLSAPAAFAEDQWTAEEAVAGVKKQEVMRYAFAGNKMILANLFSMREDCSVVEGWGYEIVKKPQHGTAEIVPGAFFPTWPKDNPRSKCNEHKIDGYQLTYTAKAGYKGPDSFTSVEISPAGLAWETTYLFNVRPYPPTTSGSKAKDARMNAPTHP
jgi:hypothetical protein